jgi:hypothetical protein
VPFSLGKHWLITVWVWWGMEDAPLNFSKLALKL